MTRLGDPTVVSVLLHVVIFGAVAVRVIMARPSPGVALAWLLIVAVLPLAGLLLYLLFGERRIGGRRATRLATLRPDLEDLTQVLVREGMADVDWSTQPPLCRSMDQLGRSLVGVPTLTKNKLELHSDTLEMLRGIARDIDAAEHSVHMEFYIWHAGGAADEVLEAVMRAAQRGVTCRVLIDHLGARPWWNGDQPKRLQNAGVQVRPALRTGLLRTLTSRNDLRLHRKIVAIDGRIAWTGSMNLVDPRFFKQDAGVGQWVDAMVRVEGYAVVALGGTMLTDWQLETGENIHDLVRSAHLTRAAPAGEAEIQVVPSGPQESGDAILQMIVAVTFAAKERLVLTTPYFIPDDSMKRALRGAAARGVQVDLIVPERVDSFFVRHATRSYYEDLLDAGVNIQLFRGGLLHTKSITADDKISMIGTVNLDMRSLWLNYEVSLFVYDADFTHRLRALQETYLEDCIRVDPAAWSERPFPSQFADNTVRLISPLL